MCSSDLANAIGTLTGGDDLIGLRGRGVTARPFTLVDDMQRQAQAQYQQTEKVLQAHLEETQKKLADLRSGKGDQAKVVITAEQRAAIDDLQHELLTTRGKLRAVQFELRRDIDRLETWLRLFNIAFVPVVLAVLAIGLGIARRRRRTRARA